MVKTKFTASLSSDANVYQATTLSMVSAISAQLTHNTTTSLVYASPFVPATRSTAHHKKDVSVVLDSTSSTEDVMSATQKRSMTKL